MAGDNGSGVSGGSIAGINVTPLVDVMLVLLVIFMVTAPIIQQGVPVDLPAVSAEPLAAEEQGLVVTVTGEGSVYLNDTELSVEKLTQKLAAVVAENPQRWVYLRADREARYGAVVKVIGALKKVGVSQLGMITDPEAG
ncbi:MAG: protein TolR [Candidatus Binatia bacterium]